MKEDERATATVKQDEFDVTIQGLLGRAILDREFRYMVLRDPEQAAKCFGVDIPEAMMPAIQRFDPNLFEWWVEGFDIARGKSPVGTFSW